MQQNDHTPVLLGAVLEMAQATLKGQPAPVLIDGTVGEGGHFAALCAALKPKEAFGLDRDQLALDRTARRMGDTAGVTLRKLSYESVPDLLRRAAHLGSPAMLLLDLGIGSHQLASGGRGFSFNQLQEPLDLRFDSAEGEPAWQVLAETDEKAIATWLFRFGEIRSARKWSSVLAAAARSGARTVGEFRLALPEAWRQPADSARLFQALRIAVNDELGRLQRTLDALQKVLPDCAALVAIISFHSLEDRLVKQTFRRWESPCVCPPQAPICGCGLLPLGHNWSRRSVQATAAEVEQNSRSRSARLRGFVSAQLSSEVCN